MAKQFHLEGVTFQYPEDWTLEPEDHEDGWGLSLYSPGTAFVTLRSYRSAPPIEEVAEMTLAAMRAEYPQLEAESRFETVGGQIALGHDLEFFSLDTTNFCLVRCFYTTGGTLLFLGQSSDVDPGSQGLRIHAILESLRFSDADEEESAPGELGE